MDNAHELPQDLPNDAGETTDDDTTTVPEEAFVVIDGVKVFPLTESVVTIGRRLGNTLVIDDVRVSRLHAQLRAINNRYVLFDLESSGGTFLNGRKISQAVVYPGDVISLAGVDLIYGQKNPPPRPDLKQTWPFDKK
jgi:pSer/pThr/pTyr-binding forkhead associated (FHA) protein